MSHASQRIRCERTFSQSAHTQTSDNVNNTSDQLHIQRNWLHLARSAKLPTGLYILLELISFLVFFFNDFSENNYLRIHWTDFRIRFTKWKRLECRWSTWTSFFSISQEMLPLQPILWKNGKLPTFVALAFRNRMGYRYLNVRINSVGLDYASISCKIFVKFGPVTPELTELICERLIRHGQKTGVFSRLSLDILDRFSQSFHHMKALWVQMMDVYLIFDLSRDVAMATK